MRLGIQFHSISESFSGLNDDGMQPVDLRPVLSKFVYNQSRRCFFHVFSFSSAGTFIHIICTRATGEPGDYDAATVHIPCGARIEGGKLATLINLLKEDIILSPSRRQDPAKASYARFFEEEHSADEYPVLPDPKTSETAYIMFGNGQTNSSLVRLLINLYRQTYSNFQNIVLIDVQENVAASQYVSLVDLSSSLLASPNILQRVEISGGVQPSGILVDDEYVTRFPLFVGSKIKLGFEHERFLYSAKTIQLPPDGVVRLREVCWDIKISRSDFRILDPTSSPVSECNVYINGRLLTNYLYFPVTEAAVAEVSVEAPSYHSFRNRLDLTKPSSFDLVLTNSKLSAKFLVGDNISFVVDNGGSTPEKSPLRGYRLMRTARDSEYKLVYDGLSVFTNPLCIAAVAIAFIAGILVAGEFSIPSIQSIFSRWAQADTSDGRPGLELFAAKSDSASLADTKLTAMEDSVAPPVTEQPDTVQADMPVEELPSPDYASACDYLKETNVWNRDQMESTNGLEGLWDAINHYDIIEIESINSYLKSPVLDEIISLLKKNNKAGSYVLDPDPSDRKADKNITISTYKSKLQ